MHSLLAVQAFSDALGSRADPDLGDEVQAGRFEALAGNCAEAAAAEGLNGLCEAWLLVARSLSRFAGERWPLPEDLRADLASLVKPVADCAIGEPAATETLIGLLCGMSWLDGPIEDVAAALRADAGKAFSSAAPPAAVPAGADANDLVAGDMAFDDLGRTQSIEPLPFSAAELPALDDGLLDALGDGLQDAATAPMDSAPAADDSTSAGLTSSGRSRRSKRRSRKDAEAGAVPQDSAAPEESFAFDALPETDAPVAIAADGAHLLFDELAPAADGLLAEAPADGGGMVTGDDLLIDAEPVAPADAGPSDGSFVQGDGDAPALSTGAMQIIEVLQAELPDIHATIAAFTGLSRSEGVEPQLVAEAREHCIDMMDRFGGAAASVGFAGLGAVFERATRNLLTLAAGGGRLSAEHAELLVELGVHVRGYLQVPLGSAQTDQLVRWSAFEGWPHPATLAEAQALARSLLRPDFSMLEEGVTQRQETAEPEDVSLDIPSDVNKDLLEGMLQELPGQSEEFSAAIERLCRGGDIDDINVAQRIAHTIKGSGNTVGIRGLAALTHNLEDILLAMAREGQMPARALAASLMNAADCLQAMTEALLGMGSAPDDARAVLQELLDWANRIDRDGLPKADDTLAPRRETTEQPQAPAGDGATNAAQVSQDKPAQQEAEVAPSLRVPAALIDQLLAGTGENIILTGQLREGTQRALSDLRSMQSQFELLQQLGAELEELIDVKDFSRKQTGIRDAGFDALEMDQYNELHSCARRLAEAATDARELGRGVAGHLGVLDELLITQEGSNRDTQNTVMRTRMIEVKSLFPRLQRSVRQTCRMLEKQVELHLAGGDTPMDSDVLNRIADPLMHLLRNAIDHGIEPEAARVAAGKNPAGSVFLEFSREGNTILVRCRDDGAGLDLESIRRTAIERGLVSASEDVSEDSLKQMILMPNFSTRSHATQVSGRGIGLDAVHTGVTQLGGSLDIRSTSGNGCTFEIRLPFNLISSHALLIRAGAEILAVASRGVEQIVHGADGSLQHLGAEPVFRLGENFYPTRTIEETVGVVANRRASERGARPVILARTPKAVVAVQVDAVLGSRDMVVKSLGQYVSKVRGVVGATILGDGKVSPVLDLPDLLSEAGRGSQETTVGARTGGDSRSGRKFVLVVDDSLSARRALAQFMQDCGFEVRSARDGVEAAQIAAGRKPDLVIADLEMPRMNGIELAIHLRASPATAQVPVIMITSRSTSKHREQALAAGVQAYMTKPYSEDGLLSKVRELLEMEHAQEFERTGTFA